MQILDLRPAPPGAGRKTLATFDIQLTDDCRMYGLRLIQQSDGRRLTYAPSAGGNRVATFTPSLAETITRAAGAALEAVNADVHDRNH